MTPRDDAGFGWKEYLGNEMVRAVLITTPERCYAPSWAHYLTAEGDNREVSVYFTTCVVRIKGFGLDRLLRKLITQRIAELLCPRAPTGSASPTPRPASASSPSRRPEESPVHDRFPPFPQRRP